MESGLVFAAIAALALAIPGKANLLVSDYRIGRGASGASAAVAGFIAGYGVSVAVALGAATLLHTVLPSIVDMLRLAGGAALVVIGLVMWHAPRKAAARSDNDNLPAKAFHRIAMHAAVTAASGIPMFLFLTVLLSQLFNPAADVVFQAEIFASVAVSISAAIGVVYAAFAGRTRAHMRKRALAVSKRQRIVIARIKPPVATVGYRRIAA